VSGIRLPLTLSVAGHIVGLGSLLFLLPSNAPPAPEPVAKGGIEVVFAPALPKSEPASIPEPAVQPETPPPAAEISPPPPEPQTEVVPPAPEPTIAASEPVPPAPEVPALVTEPTPPAPRKPAVKRPTRPVQRPLEQPQPSQAYLPGAPAQLPAAPVPLSPPQTASAATPVPAAVPSPEASAGYRALLSTWLENHKRYPDAARQRGEEGRAVLRFEVDRSGRVIDYAVIQTSGYPDLDQSIEEMMRGATLPPFPAGLPQPRMEVSVTIRFSLRR
jgi:protein TonB